MANSCRCSVGGETIRLSSQSSRVRYTAHLYFFSCFFFSCFFFPFFSQWEVVSTACMFFFLCATHHPPDITHRRPPRCPNAKSTQCTHASSGRSWAAGSSLHLPSPAKLFQRRIRVKIHQVAALHSSLALSPTYTYLVHNTYLVPGIICMWSYYVLLY